MMNNPKTLISLLENLKDCENRGVTFILDNKNNKRLSYKELRLKAKSLACTLTARGLKQGDELVFQTDDNYQFVLLFWACIYSGIIPVPVTVGNIEDHRKKVFKIVKQLNNPRIAIQSMGNAKFCLDKKNDAGISLPRSVEIIPIDDLIKGIESGEDFDFSLFGPSDVNEDSVAYIQFTSGTTADSKGAALTHKNLLTNLEGIKASANLDERDVFLSWTPLTHDLGLFGHHLEPIYCRVDQYLMPASLFIRRPLLWMEKINEYRATITSAPNFGYKYFLNLFHPEKANNWDLSSIRLVFNGGEPIITAISKKFVDVLLPFGLNPNSMFTVYGLAEACLAVAFPEVNREVSIVYVNRHNLKIGNKLEYLEPDAPDSTGFVVEGKAVKGCFIRITDGNGKICEEDINGHIEISGDNVTSLYYNNPEATKKLIGPDGWLKTGDTGFFHNGRLVVTGRVSDIINVDGNSYYAHDLERINSEFCGIELNRILITGISNGNKEKDTIVAFIHNKGNNYDEFASLADSIKNQTRRMIGINLEHVIPVDSIPRTTSGKLQRHKLQKKFLEGEFEEEMSTVLNSKCIIDSNAG